MASAAFGTAPGNLFTVAPRGAKPQSTAAEQPGELNYRQNAYGLPDALRGTGVAFDVGYVSFPLQTPRTRTTVHAFSNPLIIAGTMMPDGKMLAFTFVETSSSTKMEKMVHRRLYRCGSLARRLSQHTRPDLRAGQRQALGSCGMASRQNSVAGKHQPDNSRNHPVAQTR